MRKFISLWGECLNVESCWHYILGYIGASISHLFSQCLFALSKCAGYAFYIYYSQWCCVNSRSELLRAISSCRISLIVPQKWLVQLFLKVFHSLMKKRRSPYCCPSKILISTARQRFSLLSSRRIVLTTFRQKILKVPALLNLMLIIENASFCSKQRQAPHVPNEECINCV